MKTYTHLWEKLYGFDNLKDAYEKAMLHKSGKRDVLEFMENYHGHLLLLMHELFTQTYRPLPLKKFVLRDPKTRVICISSFRDRIIHHALVNVLQPIFEPRFIYDSYASRKGKGTLPALHRLDTFSRQVTKNGRAVQNAKNANMVQGFVLKADIRHYFDSVDQSTLLRIINKYIRDKDVLWLIQVILGNYNSGIIGKGMPLGNWTSQFFANVYLNELDQFVKQKLRAKHYLRYVDDFVILNRSKHFLQDCEQQIVVFLHTLGLELHPDKCAIIPLKQGVSFLGFRNFYHYRLVRKRNYRKVILRIQELLVFYEDGIADEGDVFTVLHGWKAYAMHGDTYNLRQCMEEWIKNELEDRTKRRTGSCFINAR